MVRIIDSNYLLGRMRSDLVLTANHRLATFDHRILIYPTASLRYL
jgi:hypothetical protein